MVRIDHLQFVDIFIFSFYFSLVHWDEVNSQDQCVALIEVEEFILGKFVYLEILNSVKTFGLCMLKISIWKTFSKVCKYQYDHFHVIFETMQRGQRAWFWKRLLELLKVGIMIQKSKMTNITCEVLFISFIVLLWFREWLNESRNVCKHSIPCYHGKVTFPSF